MQLSCIYVGEAAGDSFVHTYVVQNFGSKDKEELAGSILLALAPCDASNQYEVNLLLTNLWGRSSCIALPQLPFKRKVV